MIMRRKGKSNKVLEVLHPYDRHDEGRAVNTPHIVKKPARKSADIGAGRAEKMPARKPGNLVDELLRRFALPEHQWQFASTKTDPSLVIRRDGQAVLVRTERNVSATPQRLTLQGCEWIQSKLQQAFMAAGNGLPSSDPDPDPLRPFAGEARWLLFGDVLARAREGDKLAIQEVVVMSTEITKVLTELRGNKRTLATIKALARDVFQWPLLLGANKQLSENPQGVAEYIELGRGRVPNTGSRADWRDDEAGHIAQALLMHISAPRSWAAAKKLLLDSYPSLVGVPEFAVLPVPPSKRRTPGLHRGAILNLIRKRFESRLT